MKKSIMLHEDTTALLEKLGASEAGLLVKAMIDYQNEREVNIDDPILAAVFESFKVKMDKDNADYEAKCQRNAENIRKRWNTTEYDRIPDDTDENESIPDDTHKHKQSISISKSNHKESKRFAPPSVDDVQEYCEEKGYQIDPEAFVDFYAAKGWKVGNQPMKDWKAAVRTWTRRESSAPPGKPKAEYHNRYNDFPQRDNDYDKIQDDWIRKSFGAPLPVAGRG